MACPDHQVSDTRKRSPTSNGVPQRLAARLASSWNTAIIPNGAAQKPDLRVGRGELRLPDG